MKNVMLICHGGQSTSIMAKKVREISEGEIEINAFPIQNFGDNLNDIDLILVAPQIKFMIGSIKETVGELDIPIISIPPQIYGLMDAKALIKLIEEEN